MTYQRDRGSHCDAVLFERILPNVVHHADDGLRCSPASNVVGKSGLVSQM